MTLTTPISTIRISPSRQRTSIDDARVQDLASSIRRVGLLHPPVVRPGNDGFDLVIGERRMRALEIIYVDGISIQCDGEYVPVGEIPYTRLGDLTPAEQFEAELEENIQRVDLAWADRVAAIQQLHKMRKTQNPEHTQRDTAREVEHTPEGERPTSTAESQIARSLLVAPHLNNPEVARADSLTEAYKIVLRSFHNDVTHELAMRRAASATTDGNDAPYELLRTSCEQAMPLFEDETFDLLLADPPYGVEAQAFGKASKLQHKYSDDTIALALFIIEEGFRVCKPKSHAFIFCDAEHFVTLRSAAEDVGWNAWRTPIIWHKTGAGHAPIGSGGFSRQFEMFMWLNKGGKRLSQQSSDVLAFSSVRDKLHAAQKPVPLYGLLMKLTCLPGAKVLDPCCGSGTIFKAAFTRGVDATGIESDPDAIKLAETARLNAIALHQKGEG